MKLYLAGGESFLQLLAQKQVPHILLSYFALKEREGKISPRKFLRKSKVLYEPELFLDCGAFSAWTRGKRIRIEDYARYLQRCGDRVVYPNLDVMTSEEETRKNQDFLEARGLHPLPVYHMGAREIWRLEEMCENYDWVCIGGMVSGHGLKGKPVESERLRRQYVRIARKFGTRLHFFGYTSYRALSELPVYSADSTSWLKGGQYGVIFIPDHLSHRFIKLKYSDKLVRTKYAAVIRERGGDLEKLVRKGSWKERNLFNIDSFLEAEKELTRLYRESGLNYWEEQGLNIEAKPQQIIKKETAVAYSHSQLKGGVEPRGKPGFSHSEEEKEKISESMKGKQNALTYGRRAKKLPELRCNNCFVKTLCPDFKEGASCSRYREFNELAERLAEELSAVDFLKEKIQLDARRFQRNVVFEEMTGGVLDRDVTAISRALSQDIRLLSEMMGKLRSGVVLDQRKQVLIEKLGKLGDEDRRALRQAVSKLVKEGKEVEELAEAREVSDNSS